MIHEWGQKIKDNIFFYINEEKVKPFLKKRNYLAGKECECWFWMFKMPDNFIVEFRIFRKFHLNTLAHDFHPFTHTESSKYKVEEF